MPAMENKGAAQSAGRGEESKPGGSGNEEWSGGKSGASGGAGAGGIAALNAEALSRYPQGSKGSSGLSPAAQIMLGGTSPGTYAALLNSPLGVAGIPGVGAPMAQQPAQGGQLARNTVGSGMTPANAYGQVGIAGEKGAAPSAFPEYFAGQTTTPAIGEALQKYGLVNPNIAGTLLEEVANAMNQAALGQANNQYLAQLQSGTAPTQQTVAQPAAQQPMTPQQVYGGLTSNIGFSAPPQAQLPYGPPSRPANAPAMVQAPAAAPLQYGPESFQYANAADPFTISETMAMLGEGQTQAPVAAPAPAPAQPQMSTQEIAQNAAATSGTMPVTSYPVPTGSAVPGGGIMAGIQEALGAFGLGNLGLGNLNLGDFADTRTSEERLADFVSSQAEMSQGDDRTPVAPMFDDSGNSLPGSNGGDTTTPTPPPVITPYVPNIPAPYYTPSTLSPYVPATAPANPVYGYSSYNALQQAMGMAQGGAVGPSMTNAFAPGTYYARYNPYARGLGALRKG